MTRLPIPVTENDIDLRRSVWQSRLAESKRKSVAAEFNDDDTKLDLPILTGANA